MKRISATILDNQSVEAFFTTRHGGASQGAFSSNNLAYHVGDTQADVDSNRAKLLQSIDGCISLQAMQQIHGSDICHVDSQTTTPFADALITQQKSVALLVMVADCIPILLYDAKHKVIAAVHAGRAGAFQNIVSKTIASMLHTYASTLEELYVVLGPAISQPEYEVGHKEFEEGVQAGYENAFDVKNGHYFLDIKAIVLQQLHALGVKDAMIENIDICTAQTTQHFYSYRKEGQTGRFCGVIMLK